MLLTGAAGILSAPLHAQTRKPRLAMLLAGVETGPGTSPWSASFRKALAELGWIDGQNIEIVARFTENIPGRFAALAAELVALHPDCILTHTSGGANAAAQATATIPIVVGAASEEVLIELAGGLPRPKGNVTGLTIVSHEHHAKVLDLLKQAVPALSRVGVLVHPAARDYRDYPALLTSLIGPLGLDLVRVEARDLAGLDAAFAALAAARADALFVTTDPAFFTVAVSRRINELALALKIPVVATFEGAVRAGGLLSLGVDLQVLIRRSAVFVDKILRGARPGDLPIERPTVYRLLLNLKSAKVLGIELPPAILLRANEVIE